MEGERSGNDSGNATSFFHNVLFFPTKYHAQRNTRFSHSASVVCFFSTTPFFNFFPRYHMILSFHGYTWKGVPCYSRNSIGD